MPNPKAGPDALVTGRVLEEAVGHRSVSQVTDLLDLPDSRPSVHRVTVYPVLLTAQDDPAQA